MTAQHITARPYGMYAGCEIYGGRMVYRSSIAGCACDLLSNIPQRSPRAAGICEGDPFGGPVAMRLGVGGSWSTVGRTRLA